MMSILSSVKRTAKRSPFEIIGIVLTVTVLAYVLAPVDADARARVINEDDTARLTVLAMQNQTLPYGQLPKSELNGDFYVKTVQASAYNSVPGQTDSTPFITASGTHVRRGVVAANFLPIGTKVTFPDIYGDEVFVVEDRMNKRYQNNVDIWMEDIGDARQFGRRNVRIHIYPSN